jgi:hypothetical protein
MPIEDLKDQCIKYVVLLLRESQIAPQHLNMILFGVKNTKIMGFMWYINEILQHIMRYIINLGHQLDIIGVFNCLHNATLNNDILPMVLQINQIVVSLFSKSYIQNDIKNIFQLLKDILSVVIYILIIRDLELHYEKPTGFHEFKAAHNIILYEKTNQNIKDENYNLITNKDAYQAILSKYKKQIDSYSLIQDKDLLGSNSILISYLYKVIKQATQMIHIDFKKSISDYEINQMSGESLDNKTIQFAKNLEFKLYGNNSVVNNKKISLIIVSAIVLISLFFILIIK